MAQIISQGWIQDPYCWHLDEYIDLKPKIYILSIYVERECNRIRETQIQSKKSQVGEKKA